MLQLYAQNPHYLQFRGTPVVLVTCGEHYGSVLNGAMDYVRYLDALQRWGFNLTRTFSGVYREIPGSFGIVDNVLAPAPEAYVSPWNQVNGKYTLREFNEAYSARLRDFVQKASERGIVVELVLFCFWYEQALWEICPMHPRNNVEGIGPEDKEQVYTIEGNPLLPYMEAFVRRVVQELNAFDNVYYEIINEPYSRHDHTAYEEWQRHIARVIRETEASLPNRHLVAMNVQNRTLRIVNPPEEVSIFNFHYALPEAVAWNYHLQRVISDDETGFAGQCASPYRIEAWQFMLSGGGVFSHLDYSYTVEHPDGTAPIRAETPGYGGEDLHRQIAFLKRFLEEVEVWNLQPCNEILAWYAGDVRIRVMGSLGKRYVLHIAEGAPQTTVLLGIPAGTYHLQWLSPANCHLIRDEKVEHPGGYITLRTPLYAEDIALRLDRLA